MVSDSGHSVEQYNMTVILGQTYLPLINTVVTFSWISGVAVTQQENTIVIVTLGVNDKLTLTKSTMQ